MYGLGDDEFISGNLDLEGRIGFSDAYALEWKTGMMLSKRTRGYQLRRFKYAGYNVRDNESLHRKRSLPINTSGPMKTGPSSSSFRNSPETPTHTMAKPTTKHFM